MKRFLLMSSLMGIFLFGTVASGKPPYKKELGAANCNVCHAEGKEKKEPNPDNKLWSEAKKHADKLKEGKGEYAGKKTCNDCHQGKMKPEKK